MIHIGVMTDKIIFHTLRTQINNLESDTYKVV